MRRLAVFMAALVPLGMAVLGPTAAQAGASPSPISTDPQTFLNQSINAGVAAGSVRFIDRSYSEKLQEVIRGDVSASNAVEALESPGHPTLQVELVNGVVYVNAPASVLNGTLGLSKNVATANADKWISVQPSDSAFQTLSGSLTISSELSLFTPSSHFSAAKIVKVGKHKVIAISGTPPNLAAGTKAVAAMLISPAAPHLPVGGSLVVADGKSVLREVAAFTDWGKPVPATPPTGPIIPYSSLV